MKKPFLFIVFISVSTFAQEFIEVSFIEDQPLNVDTLVFIDNFDTSYTITNNIFHKTNTLKTISYNNIQLGTIASAHAFNPLKINLFYKDFNTVIILDNRLAEIFKIDFNSLEPFRNISHCSTGNDNTIWIFNQNTQQLEVFDYKLNKTRNKSLPIQEEVVSMVSNYNYCWLLTKNNLYKYNYFGILQSKIKNSGFTNMVESNGNIILQEGNSLFYLKKEKNQPIPIKTTNLLINQFLVTNETLYIYNHEILQKFQLKTN